MRLSYCLVPQDSVREAIQRVKLADELGFYACYSVDDTSVKDMWSVLAACADKTSDIRLGPNVTHVFLREPTLIAQSLATLDELTGGRVEAVVSTGSFPLLQQYHVDLAKGKPISRVKEALHVMRTFLDEGTIDFAGDFFAYSGLSTVARPVQERLPLKLGGMRGPRSFEVAGEVSDGLHHALSYSREAHDYAIDHVKMGAGRAGRDWRELDLAAVINIVVSDDSAAAKRAARALAVASLPTMPPQQLARHGLGQDELQPILDALAAGDPAAALARCTSDTAQRLSVAGTPEECAAQIARDMVPAGVNHVVLLVGDSRVIAHLSGQVIEGVPSVEAQLRLIAERLAPALQCSMVGSALTSDYNKTRFQM